MSEHIHIHHFDNIDHEAVLAKCRSQIDQGLVTKQSQYVVVYNSFMNQNLPHELMPHNWEELSPVVEYMNSYTGSTEYVQSWFNFMHKDSEITIHNHPRAKNYTAVYYVLTLDSHPPFEYIVNPGPDEQVYVLHPQPGDLYIFDKNLHHRVGKQLVDDLRCTIPFSI